MFHHRSTRRPNSKIQRSTPDLSADQKPDRSPRSSWRTHSAIVSHKPTPDERCRPADSTTSSGDYSAYSPSRRPRAVSPHHSRSLSCRTMKRPTTHQIQNEDLGHTSSTAEFRRRGSTMPSDSASYYLARRRMR